MPTNRPIDIPTHIAAIAAKNILKDQAEIAKWTANLFRNISKELDSQARNVSLHLNNSTILENNIVTKYPTLRFEKLYQNIQTIKQKKTSSKIVTPQ